MMMKVMPTAMIDTSVVWRPMFRKLSTERNQGEDRLNTTSRITKAMYSMYGRSPRSRFWRILRRRSDRVDAATTLGAVSSVMREALASGPARRPGTSGGDDAALRHHRSRHATAYEPHAR